MFKYKLLFFAISLFFLHSCGNREDFFSPKPRGYFRIALPEKTYREIDTIFPFRFEIPEYSYLQPDTAGLKNDYWFNVVFPQFDGVIHFSYKPVNNNLYEYTEETRNFVYKHVPKAEEINTSEKKILQQRVFGLIYNINGVEAASPTQFYITDSTSHFLRGALYFNHSPNNDSIQPIIDFINDDIIHLIESLYWKKQ